MGYFKNFIKAKKNIIFVNNIFIKNIAIMLYYVYF